MNPELVKVVWLDAWADTEGFDTLHAIEKTHRPMVIESIGWLLHADDIGVSIANEKSSDAEGATTYRGRTFVPRGMVKDVIPFPAAPKPRKKKAKPVAPPSDTPTT